MSVRGRYSLHDTDKMDASITLTMTLGEWKRLRESLQARYPDWSVARIIERMLSKAEADYLDSEEILG